MGNLENGDPVAGDDDVYMVCIKRANLDAMLGKSPLTIQNHLRESRSVVKNASLINKTPMYYARGALPFGGCHWNGSCGGHGTQVVGPKRPCT
jgi:hypothetical protein